MERYAPLRRRSLLLLLRFIQLGGVDESQAETSAATGLPRSDYFEAKRELLQLGFIDRRGNLLWNMAPRNDPPPAAPPAALAVEDEDHDYYGELASGMYKPRQLAMLVDNLPWSGDPMELMRKGSAAQKRKAQQVPALQAITLYMTGWKITDRNAKDMLTAQSESVEDVYEIVKEVYDHTQSINKKLDAPGAYLVAACKRHKPVMPPTLIRMPVEPDVDPGPQPDDDFHDPRSEQRVEEMRKALAAGTMRRVPDGWDDD